MAGLLISSDLVSAKLRERSSSEDGQEAAGLLAAWSRSRSPSDCSTDGEPAPAGPAPPAVSQRSALIAAGAISVLLGMVAVATHFQGPRALPASLAGVSQKQAQSGAGYDPQQTGAESYTAYGAYDAYGPSPAEASTSPQPYRGRDADAAAYSGQASATSAAGYDYSAAYGGGGGYDSAYVTGGAYAGGYSGGQAAGAGFGNAYDDSYGDAYGAAYGEGAPAVPELREEGPKEFTRDGGPETVAGTKLVSAGMEDLGADEVYSHPPEPLPDDDYAEENPPLEFYMYRAQSDENYPMRNVNLGDLEGVMWYLHNEIVGFPDKDYRIRHFNISRIIRFRAQIQNTPEWFREQGTVFGPYQAYNAGKCSNNAGDCDSYSKYGGLVGCQETASEVAAYLRPDGWPPLWYSLPGPCPVHEYGAKSANCIWYSPGGDCGKGNDVTGAKDCTFLLEWAGDVRLDEFLPPTEDGYATSLAAFIAAGGREYSKDDDRGIGMDFWDNIHDVAACQARVDAVLERFEYKYPRRPVSVGEPPLCDNRL